MSTSSPATLNCGSKPPTASSASRRKAMLHPGMCSATSSESRTCVGPPGAWATALSMMPASSRDEVGAADPGVVGGLEGVREETEPVAVGPGVVVGEGDDLARRRLDPGVPGGGEAAVLGPDQADVELGGDRRGAVGRAVVDDDHLVVRVVERGRAPPGSGRSSARRCTSRRRPRCAGRPCPAANGTSANAPLDRRRARASGDVRGRRARSASRRRPRRPRCHSSVQEKTNAPGAARTRTPRATAARGRRAWTSTPWLRLSRPISVISSGRSPAMLWRRARYACSGSSDSR